MSDYYAKYVLPDAPHPRPAAYKKLDKEGLRWHGRTQDPLFAYVKDFMVPALAAEEDKPSNGKQRGGGRDGVRGGASREGWIEDNLIPDCLLVTKAWLYASFTVVSTSVP